ERSAVLRALGEIASNSILDLARGDVGLLHRDAQFQRLATILDDMPLDAPSEVEDAVIRAMIQLNGTARGLGTSKHLKDRLVRKSEAGLSIANDIARLSGLPRSNLFTDPPQNAATNLFHEAFSRPLDVKEQLAFATAARSHADPSLVPALATLLDPRQPQIRYQAVEALIQINTEEAASALWPHLQEEIDLARKLELIAFLGRHGFKDGYSIAIEHLSQPALRDLAVEALASLDEPKTVPELTRIWATSHDLNWNAAAIRALARLGQNDIAPKLLEIADDLSNPLADSALIALGDLGDERAVPLVQKGLTSRSDALAIASARAAAKLLSNPKIQADAIRDQLASLLSDPMASPTLRTEALNSLVTLNDPRLDPALAQAVRDSTLEHTELGARIEAELVKRKVPLKPEE
ncbi:MAG TPA: HEAT repeat domain-containing protein, partial [Isosphaeraceae bacterium]|nr:HEAT repeat domain-containing protein [Isosphaeraceae bacterium]